MPKPEPQRSNLARGLEWFATVLSVAGAVWLAVNIPTSPWAFVLYFASTITFSLLFLREQRWTMFLLNITFMLTNLLAIYRWLIVS